MNVKALSLATALLASSQSVWAAEYTVEMRNASIDGTMVFVPSVLNVEVGDTVHFEPTDPGHNSETIANLIPEGSAGWKGGINEKISITIDKEGVYVYKCLPHTAMAMVGVIVAGEATNLSEVKQNAAALSSTFAVHKYRLEEYLEKVR
ncbi:pseudoazurin [Pontibacterium sp.]|uniref:pseudoazurin n=1 Tax=Pontibacterium sp. TaxID=2036026 RepID=UPI00351156DC